MVEQPRLSSTNRGSAQADRPVIIGWKAVDKRKSEPESTLPLAQDDLLQGEVPRVELQRLERRCQIGRALDGILLDLLQKQGDTGRVHLGLALDDVILPAA